MSQWGTASRREDQTENEELTVRSRWSDPGQGRSQSGRLRHREHQEREVSAEAETEDVRNCDKQPRLIWPSPWVAHNHMARLWEDYAARRRRPSSWRGARLHPIKSQQCQPRRNSLVSTNQTAQEVLGLMILKFKTNHPSKRIQASTQYHLLEKVLAILSIDCSLWKRSLKTTKKKQQIKSTKSARRWCSCRMWTLVSKTKWESWKPRRERPKVPSYPCMIPSRRWIRGSNHKLICRNIEKCRIWRRSRDWKIVLSHSMER